MRAFTLCALVAIAAAACGGSPATVVRATMALEGSSLDAASVGSVGVTVAAGPDASCPRVLQKGHPLDDESLEIVAHALFVVDGAASPSLRVPADRPLLFFAEAFRSPNGERPRLGRGCAEATLSGPHADVSVTITDGN